MAGRRKRKFNWDELSSEEEEAETKRTTRKDTKKVKEEKDEENDKTSKLNAKDKSPNKSKKTTAPSPTTTRSTRTSVKREVEDDENLNSKSKILKSSGKQTLKREIDDDSDVPNKVLKSSPSNQKVKNEKVTPKKENKPDKLLDDESMVLTKSKVSSNENEETDSKYADLPVISVKPVKIKLNKQDSAKKFSKKHPSPIKSKTQSLITKFKEIKIELSDEQRKWFNEQVQKYDGNYDQEFDKESNFYQKATTARKRR